MARKVFAGFVSSARAAYSVLIHSHTGDLEIDFITADVGVSRTTATMESSISVADVSVGAKILGKA
jgi:hypothetical protein